MNKTLLSDIYQQREFNQETTDDAINTVLTLENYLLSNNATLDTAEVADIKSYVHQQLSQQPLNLKQLLAMTRYFHAIKKNDIYIYLTKVLGGLGVIDNIKARIVKFAGREALDEIFKDLEEPPLGTPMGEIPKFTQKLMERIEKSVAPPVYEKFLAGNNHSIPKEAMEKEKLLYEESETLDEYLKGRHERNVAELQSYCDNNIVWYEQQISQQVVDYVQSNQEILSAVKKDNKLYVTKIPYDAEKYLNESDSVKKRYYACHCPFARESILKNNMDVSANWCYCSAGFAKFPFEVILDRELKIKLLESPLKGDDICRFEISL
ncbi:MAG: hypothetical protein KAQ68_07060 [Clostridiales bacterium]|nr:hypothetical protein [Clostridiales bacterium]